MIQSSTIDHATEVNNNSLDLTFDQKIVQASFETSPVEEAQTVIRNYLIQNGISPSAILITERKGKVTVASESDTIEWGLTEEVNPEFYKKNQDGLVMHDLR